MFCFCFLGIEKLKDIKSKKGGFFSSMSIDSNLEEDYRKWVSLRDDQIPPRNLLPEAFFPSSTAPSSRQSSSSGLPSDASPSSNDDAQVPCKTFTNIRMNKTFFISLYYVFLANSQSLIYFCFLFTQLRKLSSNQFSQEFASKNAKVRLSKLLQIIIRINQTFFIS